MAVIIKMIGNKPVYNKIDVTPEEREKALGLHKCLRVLIPQIEKEFEKKVFGKGKVKKRKTRISDKLIYTLGQRIEQALCNKYLTSEDEVEWVFKAIREIYSKKDVFLRRGKRRDDFKYIFEAAKLPYKFFKRITWDGWRRLMDSPSIRCDRRFIIWLESKYDKTKEIKRGFIRKFLIRLNALLKNKDTSVFSDAELFDIYEKAWKLSLKDQCDKKKI